MGEASSLETLIQLHASREATHAELFAHVAPEAFYAQNAMIHKFVKAREERRKHWDYLEALAGSLPGAAEGDPATTKQFTQRLDDLLPATGSPVIRMGSPVAMASSLRPVRDIIIDGILVLSEDRKLDIVGPRYPNFWIHNSGNALPRNQTIWADPSDGRFGFDHLVRGTVTGRQANSGAGLYIQFAPLIAPGIAQIRPFLPYSYQWSNLSFKSREDNLATFGIRVWSWNLVGGDFVTEQDYKYSVWNDTSIANYFATSNSPNWLDNQEDNVPGWDDDYGFTFGTEAPYFSTRPGRIYMAAIWCFGMCYSVSPENRPGEAIGRLNAQMPWVVIGYQ